MLLPVGHAFLDNEPTVVLIWKEGENSLVNPSC